MAGTVTATATASAAPAAPIVPLPLCDTKPYETTDGFRVVRVDTNVNIQNLAIEARERYYNRGAFAFMLHTPQTVNDFEKAIKTVTLHKVYDGDKVRDATKKHYILTASVKCYVVGENVKDPDVRKVVIPIASEYDAKTYGFIMAYVYGEGLARAWYHSKNAIKQNMYNVGVKLGVEAACT